MLRCRDTLDCRGEVHALVLVVEVVTLCDDKPILDGIVERRELMNIDMVGLLTPTDGRGRPQRPSQVELAQIKLNDRRATFDRGADKGVLVHLCDGRLKLHLHCNCHPIPFVTTDLPWDK